MPASAQNIPDESELADDHGFTLDVCVCEGCGLVQLDADPVDYYRDVIRSGGATMKQLRMSQYEDFIETCHLHEKKIIEVGCGAGEFLSILAEYDVKAYGMEHRRDLVEKARAAGLAVQEGYTESEDIIFEHGPFDAFTSFNFLEHQPNPRMYLKAIANNLVDEGYGLLTAPSFEYILEQKSFYEFIHDHIAYYTEDSLTTLLALCGFDIIKKERVNRDTLSFIVKKRARCDFGDLLKNRYEIDTQVQSLIERCRAEHKKLAIWGASHQGFTLCASQMSDYISFIIDSAVFKQGRYAPASHVPIVSPREAIMKKPDVIVIVAPGYTDEIAEIIGRDFASVKEMYTLMTDRLERLELRI
jgi:2-polyprenyl-3-methyl-5-hydroxy-6-metoxy-1,4-benzoquinol methylase